MTAYHVRVADNGYIVECTGEPRSLMVYEDSKLAKVPTEMLSDLLGDLLCHIVEGTSCEFDVEVNVKPIKKGGER
jgi:hypothetical protein